MLIVNPQEIAQYRSQLSSMEEALIALDMLEDCEGDLEDAAVSLAIQVGQQPDSNDWLEGMAKRCRVLLCHSSLKSSLTAGNLLFSVQTIQESGICPSVVATLVVLYAIKIGIDHFCEPLDYQV